MKKLLTIFLFLIILQNTNASRPDSSRTELLQLLKERKELFDKYSESLNDKSGFFGNRTKNDMKESHEKLLIIVEADNKIISSLNRTLDFRNFEKLNMSYDVSSYEERIRNLIVMNDTLNKQNLMYSVENKINQSTIKKHHLYFALLIILLIAMSIAPLRKYFRK